MRTADAKRPTPPPAKRKPSRAQAKKATQNARARWARARNAAKRYGVQLRKIAAQVGVIIDGFAPDGEVHNLPQLQATLNRYAELIEPWAKSVGGRMVADVGIRDLSAWTEHGRDIGVNLRKLIETAPTGQVLKALQGEQVDLITSLPREAAQRVHQLTLEGITASTRSSTIAKEILKSGEVTKSRATLIARTEVARTASMLTQVRAINIGSEGYIWRTVGDSDVRESHKHMAGKFVRWDTPPEVDPGKFYHAGQFPNCRCYPEPQIPEEV